MITQKCMNCGQKPAARHSVLCVECGHEIFGYLPDPRVDPWTLELRDPGNDSPAIGDTENEPVSSAT